MSVLTPRINNLESVNNIIINGNFDVWQRSTTATNPGSGYSTADRWRWSKSAGVIDLHRSTDVPTVAQSGFQSLYSLEADVTTGAAVSGSLVAAHHYKIEGHDYQAIHGKKVILSFWVKSNVTGTYSVSFKGTSANRSYVSEYTINTSNAWEKKEIAVELDTVAGYDFDNSIGLEMFFMIAHDTAGTYATSTLDTWQAGDFRSSSNQVNGIATTNNNFKIAQVMLHKGDAAGEFSRAGRNIRDEVSMCERYYTDISVGTICMAWGYRITSSTWSATFALPTTMRANPSFSVSQGSLAMISDLGATTAFTGASANGFGGSYMNIAGTAASSGTGGWLRGNAGMRVQFDSEL